MLLLLSSSASSAPLSAPLHAFALKKPQPNNETYMHVLSPFPCLSLAVPALSYVSWIHQPVSTTADGESESPKLFRLLPAPWMWAAAGNHSESDACCRWQEKLQEDFQKSLSDAAT